MFSKRSFSGRVGALTAGLILLIIVNLSAQTVADSDLPGWVLYEKGIFSYNQGDPDRALEYFDLSAKSGVLTPEAIYRIGQIYEEEGDYLLAKNVTARLWRTPVFSMFLKTAGRYSTAWRESI